MGEAAVRDEKLPADGAVGRLPVHTEIRRYEEEDETLRDFQIFGVADPAIFKSASGDSVADQMAREGVYFTKGDNHRIAGKMQLHNRLVFDENGIPMFYVFTTCRDFIRTIPELIYDETKVEDVNTSQEDHIFDECKYNLMENAIAVLPQVKNEMEYQDDPLDLI